MPFVAAGAEIQTPNESLLYLLFLQCMPRMKRVLWRVVGPSWASTSFGMLSGVLVAFMRDVLHVCAYESFEHV